MGSPFGGVRPRWHKSGRRFALFLIFIITMGMAILVLGLAGEEGEEEEEGLLGMGMVRIMAVVGSRP